MRKFGFSDGFKCYANTSEEAKVMHKDFLRKKVTASTFEDVKEEAFNTLGNIEDAFNHIKEEVDKSVKALDVVKQDSFKKAIVKRYVEEINKYVDETDWKGLVDNLWGTLKTLTTSSNWEDWKERCLELLPSDCSLGERQEIEKKLEEVCH